MYDLILKNGLIISPADGLNRVSSVAIQNGTIAKINDNIPDTDGKTVYDLHGKIITPGLIDSHCHPVYGFAFIGVVADEIGLNNGVTCLCDGGSAGASNFFTMSRYLLGGSKTDIVCFLNIARVGLVKLPEIVTSHDIDIDETKEIIQKNRGLIRGIKIRATQSLAEGVGIKGIEEAKKLAKELQIPVQLHIGEIRERVSNDRMDTFSRDAVSLLEYGDTLLHYLTWAPGGMILEDGTIYPELVAARKRGVLLDASNGLNNFSFQMARHAINQGILPDIISSDMATRGLATVQSLPVVLSKFLNLGVKIDQVIAMATVNAAKAIRETERGSLGLGRVADISVFELLEGKYIFSDGVKNGRLEGNFLLEPRMVLKNGKIFPAFSNYHPV